MLVYIKLNIKISIIYPWLEIKGESKSRKLHLYSWHEQMEDNKKVRYFSEIYTL